MIDLGEEAQHLVKLFLLSEQNWFGIFIQPCDSLINDHPDIKQILSLLFFLYYYHFAKLEGSDMGVHLKFRT